MLAFIPETDFADESLNGYFLRLAEENFLGSVTTLLRPTGVRFKAQYAQRELQVIADYHGLEVQRLQRLASFPTLHGSLVTGAFMRKAATTASHRTAIEFGWRVALGALIDQQYLMRRADRK